MDRQDGEAQVESLALMGEAMVKSKRKMQQIDE
jgi:hypothetical protein